MGCPGHLQALPTHSPKEEKGMSIIYLSKYYYKSNLAFPLRRSDNYKLIECLLNAAQHRAAADERVRQGDEGEPEKVTRV